MIIYDIIPPRIKTATGGQNKNIHPAKSKKILAFFTILFLILQFFAGLEFLYPKQAKAAGNTYYVDNCVVTGDDSNNGTDPTTPWSTINKVNTSSFAAGDSILFRKGCTWREQLTVPSSGTAGNVITFGSYGASGEKPIIMASMSMDTADWTAYPGSALTTDANTVALWRFNNDLTDVSGNNRTLVTAASAPTYIPDVFEKGITGNGTWYSGYDDAKAGDANAFDFGTNSFTIEIIARYNASDAGQTGLINKSATGAASTWYFSRYVNGIRFSYKDATNTSDKNDTTSLADNIWMHLAVVVNRSNNTIKMYAKAVQRSTTTDITGFGSADNSANLTVGALLSTGNTPMISKTDIAEIRISNVARDPATFPATVSAPNANLWYTNSTSRDVGSISYGATSTVLTSKKSTLGAVTSQGDFYQDTSASKTYLYSTSNPATFYGGPLELWYNGTAASNGNIIYASSKTYLVFQDLELKYGGAHGFQCVNCDNITVQRLTVSYIGGSYLTGTTRYGNGIEFWDNATNITVSNNNVSQTFDEGITIQTTSNNKTQNNDTIESNIIDKCGRGIAHSYSGTGGTITNVLYDKNTITSSGLGWAVPAISNGQGIGAQLNVNAASNTLSNLQFNNNYIKDTASGADPIGQGILFYSGWSVVGNWVENSHNTAIRAYNGGNTTTIAYNVVVDPNTKPGIFVNSFTGPVYIYNNSIYGSDDTGSQLVVLGQAGFEVTNVAFKNNIVAQFGNVSTALIDKASTNSTATLDYNLYYRSTAGNLINWGGTNYTQANWATYKSASSQDANSPTPADPLFVSTSNFTLQSTSPAINTGTNLGSDYDDGLSPASTWPSSVTTIDQNLRGSGWEIGAYVYPVPIAPTIGTPSAQSSSVIRWAFTDNSDDETEFRVYDNTDTLATSSATFAGISYLDETGLSANTAYSGRYVKAYNDYGESVASAVAATKYTLADTPTNLSGTAGLTTMDLSVDNFTNSTVGSSGFLFSNSTKGTNSGWTTSNTWSDSGLSCGTTYSYSVTYRNGDGTLTTPTTISLSTSACPVVVTASGNGAPVGLMGQHRQDVSNLLSVTTPVSTSTNLTSLQNQISALTLQLNSLLSQAHTNTTTPYTPYNFTRNLYYRMVGTDVLHLQQFLNTHGFVLTTTELGSPGNETTKFGLLTYKALKAFQTSVNLPDTGYFGPMTRGFIKNI